MGQVLGFAHCKESPSTVSTTPDSTPSSTEGGNESDFPDLHTAREFSDDEEETSVDWGTPQQSSCELTFSYITFSGSTEGDVNMGHRRDSFSGELAHSDRENRVRRQRRHKSSGLMRTETTETFISELSENTSFTLHQFHGFDADNQFYLDNLGSEEQHSLSGWDPTICFIDEPECPQSELAADDVKIKEYSQYLKHTWRETKGGSPFEKDSGITVTEIHPVCSEVFPGTETPPQSIEETVSLCRITPIHLPLADSGDKSKSNQDAPSDVITDDSGHNIVQPRPDSLLSEALSQPGATVYMDILSKESPTLPPAFNTLGCNQDRFSDDEEDVKYWLENEPFILSHHMHSDQSGNILKIRMLGFFFLSSTHTEVVFNQLLSTRCDEEVEDGRGETRVSKKGTETRNEELVVNISSYRLTEYERSLLNCGLSFIPSKTVDITDAILDVKLFMRQIGLSLMFGNTMTDRKDVFAKPSTFMPQGHPVLEAFEKACERDLFELYKGQSLRVSRLTTDEVTLGSKQQMLAENLKSRGYSTHEVENVFHVNDLNRNSKGNPYLGNAEEIEAFQQLRITHLTGARLQLEYQSLHKMEARTECPGRESVCCSYKQKVADLLYWKDLKTSAIVLTGLMLVLLSLSQFSVITVVSYVTLLVLCATVSLRVYKKILQALHKSDGANPFQEYLDMDMFVSKEQLQKYVETIILYFASLVKELRRLILVEDLVDSIKFAVLMWLLTFIGAVFNGLTILILAVISMFTIPLLYRQHQAQIDQYVGLVTAQISDIRAKIQAKLPSAKSKAE
ncbi:uncharacterized protein LOC122795996 [Protopterus annectens]|uniref:uncharacterized protein LOC122795996 n=1 Tax=Protopterus annectens TaxID=7888 RepID=UPI001CFAEC7B|nr:uncharacterized protein LOC122795996 [Protopterus annectens]